MKAFTITEAQLEEIGGRLDAICRFGIAMPAAEHVKAIVDLLRIAAQSPVDVSTGDTELAPEHATNGHATA